MLIKRTKMIVITKNNLIKSGLLIILAVLCVICIISIKRTSVSTFSGYKTIIDSELTPENDEKSIAKSSILKHFFVFGDTKKDKAGDIKTETPKDVPESEPEKIVPEEKKIVTTLSISNSTDFAVNPEDYLQKPLAFSVDGQGVEVIVMHTHTTESFCEEQYVPGASDRNLDSNYNITAVGDVIASVLNGQGINTLHDTTVHDYPSYNGAYQRAAKTIQKDIRENGNIKVVLDIHRDGITKSDGTKVKLATDINGVKTAQVMLVVGTNATLTHDNWEENFKFASKIQAKAMEMYPSLMRPIDVRQERFNEQLTKGSLIIEIGTNGNTLNEAKEGGKAIANVIAAVLKGE